MELIWDACHCFSDVDGFFVFVFFVRMRTFKVPHPMFLPFFCWFSVLGCFPVAVRLRKATFCLIRIHGAMLDRMR
jgi:hypothetical protein